MAAAARITTITKAKLIDWPIVTRFIIP